MIGLALCMLLSMSPDEAIKKINGYQMRLQVETTNVRVCKDALESGKINIGMVTIDLSKENQTALKQQIEKSRGIIKINADSLKMYIDSLIMQ